MSEETENMQTGDGSDSGLEPQVLNSLCMEFEKIRIRPLVSRVVKSRNVGVSAETIVVGGDVQAQKQSAAPQIVVDKKGGRVHKITVLCSCGKHAELICEYDEQGNELVMEEAENEL